MLCDQRGDVSARWLQKSNRAQPRRGRSRAYSPTKCPSNKPEVAGRGIGSHVWTRFRFCSRCCWPISMRETPGPFSVISTPKHASRSQDVYINSVHLVLAARSPARHSAVSHFTYPALVSFKTSWSDTRTTVRLQASVNAASHTCGGLCALCRGHPICRGHGYLESVTADTISSTPSHGPNDTPFENITVLDVLSCRTDGDAGAPRSHGVVHCQRRGPVHPRHKCTGHRQQLKRAKGEMHPCA